MQRRVEDIDMSGFKRLVMAVGPMVLSGVVSGTIAVTGFAVSVREDLIRAEARHAALESQIATEAETRRAQVEAGRQVDIQLLASLQDQIRASTECRIALARLEAARGAKQ